MTAEQRMATATTHAWWRTLLGLALLPAAIGCSSDPVVVGAPIRRIVLTPSTASVRAGSTVSLTATLTDSAGSVVTGQPISWSSNSPSVATVSRVGVVSTLAPGEARIAASAFGISATATITVIAREVASVVLTPASVSMQVGASAPLQARALDSEGGTLSGRAIAWTSTNPAVATVNAQGVIAALAPGVTTVIATSEGRSAQAAVTVTAAPVNAVVVSPARDTLAVGTQRALAVVLRDINNAVLTGRAVSWSSSNASIATVSSSGVVIGLAPGTVTITANSEGRTGTSTMVVVAQLASTVTISPSTATLVVGATQSLSTQITDAQGNLLAGRPVSFASDAPSVATVSLTGVVSALAPGRARITATSEGKSGTATIEVVPVPVATVELTPTATSLVPGSTQQLTAVARSAAGVALSGRAVTWISGAPGVATVSANGLVTAVANGVALVLAQVDGVTATATITVAPVAVAAIVIAPADPQLVIGTPIQLSATVRSATGVVLTGRSVVWSSADEAIAFVTSTGQLFGFRPGAVRITATSEGVSASTLVTVR